jgi:tetratricopeptide (TPR) repeat protein
VPAPDKTIMPLSSDAKSAAPAAPAFSLWGSAAPRWYLAVAVLFLVVVARLAYHNSFETDLALDNALIIGQDTRLHDWKWEEKDPSTGMVKPDLKLIFKEGYWYPSFPSDLYRPLTTITYAFNYSGPELRGAGADALKFFLFFAAAGAVFLLARPFIRPWWLALSVAGAASSLLVFCDWHWSLTGNVTNPYGYHVTNLLIHLLNVLMVLVVMRRISGRPWLALLAAAIFAVHPAETESVTNIVGRADELCTFWILLAFWFYLRATVSGVLRPLWLIGFMLPATAAMFSKESGVMLVLLLPLYDFIFRWPKLTGSLPDRLAAAFREFFLKGWIALALPGLFFFGVRAGLIESTPTYGQLFIDNPIARVPAALSQVTAAHKLTTLESLQAWWYQITVSGELTAFKVLGRYVGLMVFPSTLSCDYSYNQIPLFGEGAPLWEDVECVTSLLMVLGLLWVAWSRRLRNPLFSFGVFFFFGMILPTANIVFPIGSIMGERFLYLPSVGFCLVASLGLGLAAEKISSLVDAPSEWRPWAGLSLPLVVLLALGIRTYARNADWKSEFSLWHSAVAAAPNSFKVHKGLANGYLNSSSRIPDAAVREKGVDDAIARAEVGLAVIDSKPLPIQRQDNTLFSDLGMYYNIKARYLSDPNRKDGPVLSEAARFFQKGVDVMTRAKEVDTWVNGASRGSKLQRGIKPEEIADVGNPRIHNQLGESYLGLGQVQLQVAGAYLEQVRMRFQEQAAVAAKEGQSAKKAEMEVFANAAQFSDAYLDQARKKFEELASTASGDDKKKFEDGVRAAQGALGFLAQAKTSFDKAIEVASYCRHLAPNQTQSYLLLAQAFANINRLEAAAVAMFEALQIDPVTMMANPAVWESLRQTYANLGQTNAIFAPPPSGGNFQLNLDNELVKRHFFQAAGEVVQLLVDAKDFDNAGYFRKHALIDYHVPETALPQVPEPPAKLEFGERLWKWVQSLLTEHWLPLSLLAALFAAVLIWWKQVSRLILAIFPEKSATESSMS